MNALFIEYPPCSTCKKAKKFLLEHGISLESRHIVQNTPTIDELKEWYEISGLELKKFFNTSGNVYKTLQLKDKLPNMKEEEMLELLASDGMLIKRPIFVYKDTVLVGFKKENYEKLCSNT